MSITHYACLGLWAAERAGAQVDPQVWQRALDKIGGISNPDGGFSYWRELRSARATASR